MSRYRFDEIAINCKEKRTPTKEDMATYIGLEHLDSKNIIVSRWGSDVPIKGDKLVMHKGDVLLGKRNAYLRRAAVAPHDGLFSAHGMVLQPQEKVIDKNFFPFFILSDYFFDAATMISVGSLSPTINWKDLARVEFNIPPLDRQRELAKILWAMNDTMEQYRILLHATDELVKSEFIERFGDLSKNTMKYDLKPLSDVLTIERGGSPRPIEKYITDSSEGVNWIKIGDAEEGSIYITHSKEKITLDGIKKSRHVEPGDFLLSNSMSFGRPYILMIDGYIHDGWLVLRDTNKSYDKLFLHTLLSSEYAKKFFQTMASGSVVKNLNKDLVGKLMVPIPSMKSQLQFSDFISENEKSKCVLQTTMSNLQHMFNNILENNMISI